MTLTRENMISCLFTHIDVVITRNNEGLRPKYFFQPLRPASPVRYHACLSSCAKLAKTNQAISRKWPKRYFGFCGQNLAYFGPYLPEIFFQPRRPPSPVRYHVCLSSYAKLAKTNDAISRKWLKTSFWAKFWPFLAILGPNNFFFENRASSL